ncbi:sulfite exporter TauE/SafE family protein [Tessaracoccus sp. MC1865]|uniref:sulfite exporter TauE/SafE family protein n=1 Tax=Tessaracoccus sp. MC1865 TaxID=2760310 RepID=UPI00160397F7|nr:sulfite exporter TauE/SafE family protein [Tessaracoccus sp. MC1865]MBB1484178.1 sulfite exporter TauE/SafE family protein [Tessaracoccus sp. MC1865]QTO37200.1 sulfite exporter TauE/SafE family protein [Tessaracoccus sp. MC1865]
MVDLAPLSWAALVAAALLIGVAKTAVPGAAIISVAVFAAVLPARESTAALLALLLVGDLLAVYVYRHNVDFRALRRLAPSVVVGLVLGAALLAFSDDTVMRRSIGVILLTLTALTLYLMRRGVLSSDDTLANPHVRGLYGALGGFTSMAANAGGPVMTLYFVAARFDVMRFIATQAWFFFAINVAKLPFSIGLGLFRVETLPMLAILAPVVLLGAFAGRRWIRRLDQRLFTRLVIGLTIISSLYLLR